MAQISYRANLSTAIFPMTLARAGRSVIVPTIDQNFDRRVDPEGAQRNAGIPQIIYGENIVPTADGYQSVGYSPGGSLGTTGVSGVNWVPIAVNLPSSGYKQILLLIGAGVVKATYDGITYSVVTVIGVAPNGSGNFVSTATVRGICYLHVGSRIYALTQSFGFTLTEVTATLTPVGILTNLVSICGSFNYLVLVKSDGTVNWSSTTTPTDFTPSLVSGAGSGALTNNSGAPLFTRASPFGFYVHCRGNVLAVTYTGNARYPWRFLPVQDSEGVLLNTHIAGEISDSNNYILSNSGYLVQISQNSAAPIAPEISEIVGRLRYTDTFDTVTNTFGQTATSEPLNATLHYLMDKYILFGKDGTFYLYDMQFRRYGKLKTGTNYVIDLEPSNAYDVRSLAFIDLNSGVTKIASFNVNNPTVVHSGVMVLGKFQYVRSRFICVDEVSIESAQLGFFVGESQRNFEAYAIPTLDGKTFKSAQALVKAADSTTGDVMTYNSAAEGKNVSILLKGAFDLSSVDLLFHVGGSV